MGADSLRHAVAAAEYAGLVLTPERLEQLGIFRDWLAAEALEAGGIGPHEEPRLWRRHIADSLLFGIALGQTSTCADIGSGVGLPGIPLAIAVPEVRFLLVDRAGRRCDLARRALSILGLKNCDVVQQDIDQISGTYDALVSRAAIPPQRMMIHVKRLLASGGTAIIGLSHGRNGPKPPGDPAELMVSLVTVPSEVLDSGVNLLRIEAP